MLYLDGVTHDADHTIALGKLLASAFLIRGAQLAVVRRLDSANVVNVHTGAINFICKKIASYEASTNKNSKKARNRCLMFFKVLTPLVNAVDSREALKV